MSAVLAMSLGLLAVGFAAWPLLRGARPPALPDEGRERAPHERAEADAAILRDWSVAAGEVRRATAPRANRAEGP